MLYEWERGMELEWEDIQTTKLPAESKRSCELGDADQQLTTVPSRAHKTIPTLKEIHLSPVSCQIHGPANSPGSQKQWHTWQIRDADEGAQTFHAEAGDDSAVAQGLEHAHDPGHNPRNTSAPIRGCASA